MMTKSVKAASKKSTAIDRVLIAGRTKDGQGLQVLRHRNDRIELGVAQPLQEGKAIQGEVVRLKPHKDFPLLCDVEVQVDTKAVSKTSAATEMKPEPGSSKGPAKVNSERYRKNWQNIFGNQVRNTGNYLN